MSSGYLTPDVNICISVASRPGKMGVAMHNAGYSVLGLNFVYKAFGSDNIENIIKAVRTLNIKGCSVSMPFKQDVMPLLDELSETAKAVGAVNTVVNMDGRLVGYNTDATGIKASLAGLELDTATPVLVLGAGGVACAVMWALQQLGFTDVTITSRRAEQYLEVATRFKQKSVDWENRELCSVSMVINATPIGMAPEDDDSPLDLALMKDVLVAVDLVANPPLTKFIQQARQLGLKTISGVEITLEQALDQFKLYTGKTPPREEMANALFSLTKFNKVT